MNELDTDINIAEVVSDMRSDFDYILEVLDNMARGLFKEQKISKSGRQADKPGELYTINEIACLYRHLLPRPKAHPPPSAPCGRPVCSVRTRQEVPSDDTPSVSR
jgi:hypothetical protein